MPRHRRLKPPQGFAYRRLAPPGAQLWEEPESSKAVLLRALRWFLGVLFATATTAFLDWTTAKWTTQRVVVPWWTPAGTIQQVVEVERKQGLLRKWGKPRLKKQR